MNDETVIRPGGRQPKKPTAAQGQAGGQAPQAPQAPQSQGLPQGQAGQSAQAPQSQGLPQGQAGYAGQSAQPPQSQGQPQGQAGYAGQSPQPPQSLGQPQGYSSWQQPLQADDHNGTDMGTGVIDLVTPLLSMVTKLKSAGTHPNLDEFKTYAADQIRYFQSQNFALTGQGLGPDRELLGYASYGLCALIDELVLNTPWGTDSSWSAKSLLVIFHNQAWGGEQFFSNLDEMLRQPGNTLAVLSLYYVSLELGFLGKYRELPSGLNDITGIKSNLFNVIKRNQPQVDSTLSPAWRGVSDERNGIVKYAPFWVTAVVTLGIGVTVFSAFYWSLGDQAFRVERQIAQFATLQPFTVRADNSSLLDYNTEPLNEPDLVRPVVDFNTLLRALLQDEISRHKVLIEDDDDETLIKLTDSRLFASASDRLSDEFVVIVKKIGQLLADHDVRVKVTGHTDNQPMTSASMLRFSNNYDLSQARADKVVEILLQGGADIDNIDAIGLADTQPIGDNETRAGRAKNRRVEIKLFK